MPRHTTQTFLIEDISVAGTPQQDRRSLVAMSARRAIRLLGYRLDLSATGLSLLDANGDSLTAAVVLRSAPFSLETVPAFTGVEMRALLNHPSTVDVLQAHISIISESAIGFVAADLVRSSGFMQSSMLLPALWAVLMVESNQTGIAVAGSVTLNWEEAPMSIPNLAAVNLAAGLDPVDLVEGDFSRTVERTFTTAIETG